MSLYVDMDLGTSLYVCISIYIYIYLYMYVYIYIYSQMKCLVFRIRSIRLRLVGVHGDIMTALQTHRDIWPWSVQLSMCSKARP